MAITFSRATGRMVERFANTPDVIDNPALFVVENAWLQSNALPSCEDRLMIAVEDGESFIVREMTNDEKALAFNPPESMADRHAREQREGVTLTNGWQMAYTREARDVMGDLKNLIDLAGPGLPGVSFWEVDGTKHDATVADAVAIMTDYAVKSAAEVLRQFAEVSANG